MSPLAGKELIIGQLSAGSHISDVQLLNTVVVIETSDFMIKFDSVPVN